MPFKQWTDEEVLNDFDLDKYLVQQVSAIKEADESVISSISVQDDNELVVPLLANSRYFVEFFIIYTAIEAADLRIGWSVPTGASMDWTHSGLAGGHPTGGTDNSAIGRSSRTHLTESEEGWVGGAQDSGSNVINCTVPGEGHVETGGFDGNLQFRWAQWTSNATASIVYANSLIIAQKLTD